jgi:hypothetical protein
VHQRRFSTVKGAEFDSNMVSYVVLRSHWCDITVMNVLAPSRERRDDSKYSFY